MGSASAWIIDLHRVRLCITRIHDDAHAGATRNADEAQHG